MLLGLVILTLGTAGIASAAAWWEWTRPGPLAATRDIVVPHGSLAEVADTLRADGAIADALPLRAAALLTRPDGPVRAGEFAFPARASLRTVLAVLRAGKPVEHHLTVPEGWTGAAIARALAADDALAGPVPVPADGLVLPQTYDFERGTGRGALLARMEAAMRRAADAAWAGRDRTIPLRSPAELVTLASIVERETHLPAERPLVASVFLNRLKAGMRLQSDPTVAYAAAGGLGPLPRPLTRADLALDNPYNTYVTAGLPPGAIAAPGTASLAAVAHPAATDDLYFVADGTGGHLFASTLAAQNRNVARWRALEGRGTAVVAGSPGSADGTAVTPRNTAPF